MIDDRNHLRWMNIGNFAAYIQLAMLELIKDEFKKDIVALEIGSAYGGGVEMMAKSLKGKGKAYGYDTFEGHPEDLADDKNSSEARAMDIWYEKFDKKELSYDYQRKILDKEDLDNAILVKGRVNRHSFNNIKKAHLIMFDMDLIKPTKVAYEALKNKIVKNGYLFFHDTLPPEHLPLLYKYVYNKVLKDKNLQLYKEFTPCHLTIIKKI